MRPSYGVGVELQLPVIWNLHGTTSPGRLDVSRGRLALISRDRAFSFPLESVAAFVIERGPARRLRGLPVLSVRLVGGETLLVASMGGPGSLQDLAAVIGGRQACDTGTRAATVVPLPGADSISSVPPTSARRSRIPVSPSASGRIWDSSKPCPSSSIVAATPDPR